MRKKYVMGNWKMNGDRAFARSLLTELATALEGAHQYRCAWVVFPPAVYLSEAQSVLGSHAVLAYGAQDVSDETAGACTGEISATMLTDTGAATFW